MAVAYSAGRDSTALLHATARACQTLGFDVIALHVHHGLMPQADDWLAMAERQCRRWREQGLPVRLLSTRLTGKPTKGDSVEAWARRERRLALAGMAKAAGVDTILLAQHRRDQAETVLLQALRGAGPAGLAAMPRAVQRDGLWWLRPWVDQPGDAIAAYVRHHRLRHVDDTSNADPRFARSRLRATLWTPLTAAFGDAEAALAAVAQRAQQAQELLAEVAEADLALLDDNGRLALAAWRVLSPARRANALRAWLHRALGRGAPETLMARLLADLPVARQGRWPADGDRIVALYRARLSVTAAPPPPRAPAAQPIDLSRPGVHPLPAWAGALTVERVAGGGVSAAVLKACELRVRRGGEQFQARPGSTPRSLKKQYQAAGVAAWQRDGPLVYAMGRLLFVPGLGIDARWLGSGNADGGAHGLALRWRGASDEAPGGPRGAARRR